MLRLNLGVRIRALILLALVWVRCWSILGAASIPVAIVLEDEASEGPADILASELSKNPVVALMERTELARVIEEQALSLAKPGEVLRAGALAGAEVVVLLDQFESGQSESGEVMERLTVRLLWVKHGILLREWELAWPIEQMEEWARGLAGRVAAELARLAQPEASLARFSVLPLRSATDSRANRVSDRELTALLLRRLASETNSYVLDRQKLGTTFFERELQAEESAFWKGSHLIEGTLDPDGFSPETLVLLGRLTTPGQTPQTVRLTRPRAESAGLIGDFARWIFTQAAVNSPAEWEPEREAEQFFEEAKWSLRWGLATEARGAADAAWALGRRDVVTAGLRVQACALAARPDVGMWVMGTNHRRRKKAMNPPESATLAGAIAALSIYDAYSRSLPGAHADTNTVWQETGVSTLERASQVLGHYYATAESRPGQEGSLAELRGLCRDVAGWLASLPSVRAHFFPDDLEQVDREKFNVAMDRSVTQKIFALHARVGGLWWDSLEDGVKMHRMLITAPGFPMIRHVYFGDGTEELLLGGWTWEKRRRDLEVWRGLLDELERSTNLVLRLEGKMLRIPLLRSVGEILKIAREATDLVETNLTALAAWPVPLYLQNQLRACVDHAPLGIPHEFEEIRDELGRRASRVGQAFTQAQDNQLKALAMRQEGERVFPRQMAFLKEARPEVGEAVRLFRAFEMTTNHAETLLPLLREYRERLTNQLAAADGPAKGSITGSIQVVATYERDLLSALAKATNRAMASLPQTSGEPNKGTTSAGARPRPEPLVILPEVRTNTLAVRVFRPVPPKPTTPQRMQAVPGKEGVFVLDPGGVDESVVTGSVIHGGKAWLRFQSEMSNPWGMIASVALASGAVEKFELPASRFQHPISLGWISRKHDFQIWRGALYVAGDSQLQIFNLNERAWTSGAVPLDKESTLQLVNDQLYAGTAEAILEMAEGGKSFKTLASVRRRASGNALDQLENLRGAILFPGPAGARVFAADTLFQPTGAAYEAGWKPDRTAWAGRIGDTLFVRRDQDYSGLGRTWAIGPRAPMAVALFEQTSPNWPQHPRPMSRPKSTNAPPLWPGMEKFYLHATSGGMFGDDYVGLATITTPPGWRGTNEFTAQPLLIYLKQGETVPVILKVAFGKGVPSFYEQPKSGRPGRSMMLFTDVSPEYLIMGSSGLRGVWPIPWGDITNAVSSARLRPPGVVPALDASQTPGKE